MVATPASPTAAHVVENDENLSPFRVLGIAMVVDQLGKGPRMVLRYPTSTSCGDTEDTLFYTLSGRQMAKLFRPKPALCGQPMTLSVGGTVFCCCAVLMDDWVDEAATTPQSAGTSTVVVPPQAESGTSEDVTTTNKDHLVLFSVIVALAPPLRTSSIPFGSWLEPEPSQNPKQTSTPRATGGSGESNSTSASLPTIRKASSTFLSVRRVHVSLARLCRILEREERRCRYVSTQARLFHQIRQSIQSGTRMSSYLLLPSSAHEAQQEKESTIIPASTTTTLSGPTTTSTTISSNSNHPSPELPPTPPPVAAPSPGSVLSSKASSLSHTTQSTNGPVTSAPPPAVLSSRQQRQSSSFTMSLERDAIPSNKTTEQDPLSADEVRYRQEELEQEILETMMAAPPTSTFINDVELEHQGNLARELLQVYHALARQDHGFIQTASNVLSGRESVVYINRHVAVAIEAVAPMRSNRHQNELVPEMSRIVNTTPTVRSYLTLYFANVSPNELLVSMAKAAIATTTSPCVSPRRLPQLLRMVNPQKTLMEIAMDANLSVQSAIEVASYLVSQGLCLALPVLSRNVRLACSSIGMIRKMALPFSQVFGSSIQLFVLISFLTDSYQTLGDALAHLVTSENRQVCVIRDSLRASVSAMSSRDKNNTVDSTYRQPILYATDPMETQAADLEDLLYHMVVWLCSHEVLVQLQDYMVATDDPDTFARRINDGENVDYHQFDRYAERKSDSSGRSLDSQSDDILYRALWESDCFTGQVSKPASCWKTGIDPSRLTSFIARHPSFIRCVTRIPISGDDWGAVL